MPLWTDLPPAGPVSPTDTLVINQGGTFAQVQAGALGGGGGLPPGVIQAYGGSTVPSGWLPCDGSAVSRTTFAALFAALGVAWGSGDGSTTFNVPDLRGRAPIGAGTGSGLSPRSLAGIGGEEGHILVVGELAAHQHGLNDTGHTHTVPTGGGTVSVDNTTPLVSIPDISAAISGTSFSGLSMNDTGNGDPHNTMQPFAVVLFIVKT